jgi:hypothetical protein
MSTVIKEEKHRQSRVGKQQLSSSSKDREMAIKRGKKMRKQDVIAGTELQL